MNRGSAWSADRYRQSIQAAGNDTQRLTDRVDRLTKSLDNLAKSTGKKLTIFGAGTLASITATTAAFASFDKQMTALKVTAEVTNRNYDGMVRGVNTLRKEFGESIERNATHGSDAPETAAFELGYFFRGMELL